MEIQFFGAAREVTGSCLMVRCGDPFTMPNLIFSRTAAQ